jgi:hypothetical protein
MITSTSLSINSLIIGVDPGEKGAIACIYKPTETLLFAFNFPLKLEWGHKVVDLVTLEKQIRQEIAGIAHIVPGMDYSISDTKVVVDFTQIDLAIERVASYGQGNKSAFSFGANSLGLINAFRLMGFNVLPGVMAAQWKRPFQLTGVPKPAVVSVVNQMFDRNHSCLPEFILGQNNSENELTIGMCDAALVALYAAKCTEQVRQKVS